MVQEEMRRRREAGSNMQCVSIFSSRIICGDCGGYYGRKIWHSSTKYTAWHWHCNAKFQKRRYCETPTLKEESLEETFVEVFNGLIADKDEIMENYRLCIDAVTDDSKYRRQLEDLNNGCGEVQTLIRSLLMTYSRQDTADDIHEKLKEYEDRLDTMARLKQELDLKIAACAAKRVQITGFLNELMKHDAPLAKFDPLVWQAVINYAKSVLASRIVCGDCGSFYGSKVWNSNSQYRRVIWQCNSKFKGEKCTTPHLEEQDIYQRFLTAYNALLGDKDALCEDCRIMQAMLSDTSAIDADLESLRSELEIVVGLTRKCISENTVAAQDQAEYEAKYNALATRYNDIIAQIQATEQRRDERLNKAKRIETYMEQIKSQSGELTVFDPRLWLEVVDIATVYHDGSIIFRFLDGREIEA